MKVRKIIKKEKYVQPFKVSVGSAPVVASRTKTTQVIYGGNTYVLFVRYFNSKKGKRVSFGIKKNGEVFSNTYHMNSIPSDSFDLMIAGDLIYVLAGKHFKFLNLTNPVEGKHYWANLYSFCTQFLFASGHYVQFLLNNGAKMTFQMIGDHNVIDFILND